METILEMAEIVREEPHQTNSEPLYDTIDYSHLAGGGASSAAQVTGPAARQYSCRECSAKFRVLRLQHRMTMVCAWAMYPICLTASGLAFYSAMTLKCDPCPTV